MSQFNLVERSVAKALRQFPGIKCHIKTLYQRLNYLICCKSHCYQTELSIHALSKNGEESFFGYYDKSPLNETGDWVLYHSVPKQISTKQLPNPTVPVGIMGYHIPTQETVRFSESYAYNWQQGARLQWVNETDFIFNDYSSESDTYVSHIYSVKTKQKIKTLPFPIYDVKGTTAITLDFDRLAIMRPDYGYRNRKAVAEDLDRNGLYLGDLNTSKVELIMSLSQLAKLDAHVNMKNTVHKVNHIMLSPSGTKFMVLHRYFVDGVKWDRLITMNCDGTNPQVLVANQMVSHCNWEDDDTIVGFLRNDSGKDGYYRVDVASKKVTPLSTQLSSCLGDGHPSVLNGKMITDTYPDKARMKHLLCLDMSTNTLKELGQFKESFDYGGETRCDLHPRWSPDGTKVFFDSVHSGQRQLYYLSLKNE
ncbi:glycosyl transferase [bacterium]|jgi:hypothetical protein|nr:glycosyl transferase [bacterium]